MSQTPFTMFDPSNPPEPGMYWALVQRPNLEHAGYATRRVLIGLRREGKEIAIETIPSKEDDSQEIVTLSDTITHIATAE